LYTCTVSVSLLTTRSVPVMLKFILHTRALFVPRRYSPSFSAFGIENTRMTVPLSEAVASIVPWLFMAKAAMGDLCAVIMFCAVRVRVSKIRMVPVDDAGDGGGCDESGDAATGTGAG
jgi:hypothetical protein